MTRILVIDDDVTLAELMRVVLEDAGHAVSVTTGPSELPGGGYDCVVTDLVTLRIYDVDAAREWVRTLQDRYPGVPVILVTAHAQARADQASFGAAAVVNKPFDVEELIGAVGAVTS